MIFNRSWQNNPSFISLTTHYIWINRQGSSLTISQVTWGKLMSRGCPVSAPPSLWRLELGGKGQRVSSLNDLLGHSRFHCEVEVEVPAGEQGRTRYSVSHWLNCFSSQLLCQHTFKYYGCMTSGVRGGPQRESNSKHRIRLWTEKLPPKQRFHSRNK